ncbi:STAS domain-containing protein [Micromonospora sp. R77]|uniref:STAS domain-containing protein n=1 Tax=Micromonospora sp. R77 TaxID=2925836 RepID=UPI001F603DE9|nr:STAS domain-containing protein [Micromonospora sp. R77]MCI4066395.1 STAS domain-containing protein [Micromonospora sp. R77]
MSVHQAPPGAVQQDDRPSLLALALAHEGEAAVVAVQGPLDMDTVGLLVDLVDSVLAGQPPPVLVLDLSAVDFFGAAGITALLTARQRVSERGCLLVLRRPSRITAAVLELVGLGQEFITD